MVFRIKPPDQSTRRSINFIFPFPQKSSLRAVQYSSPQQDNCNRIYTPLSRVRLPYLKLYCTIRQTYSSV